MTRRAGFTLVELLVALMIFGLIAAGGVEVLTATLRAREAVAAADARLAGLGRLHRLLQMDLAAAIDQPLRRGYESSQPAMEVEPSEDGVLLRLMRSGSDGASPDRYSGPLLIEYRLVEGRLERRASPADDASHQAEPQILIHGIEIAQLEAVTDAGAPWASSEEHPLPVALRLKMAVTGLGPTPQAFLVGSQP